MWSRYLRPILSTLTTLLTSTSYTMRTNIGRLPARDVGFVGLVAQQVLLQLVEVEADEPPVGDGAAELGMLDGLLEAGFVRFEERLAALLGGGGVLRYDT